jgi:hypothetical protein
MSKKAFAAFGFFRSSATTNVTPEQIRREQQAREDQRATLVSERQALAHGELRGNGIAIDRRRALAASIHRLDQELLTLAEALPTALAQEQAAYRRERERLIAELRTALTEREHARQTLLGALAAAPLPTVQDMNALRVLARECADLGFAIAKATGDVFDPVDALQALRSAMHDRHREFEHRWQQTRPNGKPDFADRPWRAAVERLHALREPA